MIHAARRKGPAGRAQRRGVAMLLVIVALGTATVVTTSYLASRRNSPAIGRNAVQTAEAEASAQAGADIGLAILQTEKNWRSASADKTLINGMTLGDATVEIRVTDLEGNPPEEDDRNVIVTSIATVGDMRAVSEKIVRVNPDVPIEEAADPELMEFAAFASERVRIDDNATLAPWPLSPASGAGSLAKLGAGFNSLSDLNIGSGATLSNVALYPDDDALQSLVTEIDNYDGGEQLPMDVPAVRATLPGDLASLGEVDEDGVEWDVPDTPISGSGGQYGDVVIKNNAIVVLGDSGNTEFSVDDFVIDGGGVVRVDGEVRMHVRDDLIIQNGGTVELTGDSSSITFYIADRMNVNDAALGLPRDLARDPGRRRRDVTAYQNPSRVRLFSLAESDGGVSRPRFEIDNRSLVNASIHAPGGELHIHNDATLFGRVAASEVHLQEDTALLYDPALDNGAGFTSLDGLLYDDNGELIKEVKDALTSYGGGGLQALESHLVSSLTDTLSDLLDGGDDSEPFITPRSAQRAKAREWPIRVMAMERRGSGSGDLMSGSFVEVNTPDEDNNSPFAANNPN